jgi:galactokinase/mevalonate kinase-like predicted kinase
VLVMHDDTGRMLGGGGGGNVLLFADKSDEAL